jgi:hypothetical protein
MPTLAVFQLYRGSPQVDMLLHSDKLFWFRANLSLLLLLNPACFAGKQHITILFRPTISRTRGKRAYHYTIRLLTKNLVETELPDESGANSGSLISRDDIVNVLCYY